MHSPRQLVRNFILTTIGGLAVVLVLVLLCTKLVIHVFAVEDGEKHNAMMAKALGNSLAETILDWTVVSRGVDPASLWPSHPQYQALQEGVTRITRGLPILKVEIYDRDGRVIYSPDPDDLGTYTESSDRAFKAALLGILKTGVEYDEAFLTEAGDTVTIDAIGSYMPIAPGTGSGDAIGVFEIYSAYDDVLILADRYFSRAAVLVLLACMILYGIVTLFVWRAQTQLGKARDALAEAHQRAQAASEAKSAFLASMSHELRTPLNAIIGFSELIRDEVRGPVGDQVYRDYAGDIAHSGNHLRQLIDDVLDMAKIEAGRIEPDPAECDIVVLVRATVRLFEVRAEEAQVALRLEVPTELPACTDERLIRQVLLNLVSNAIKFTPKGGSVVLAVTSRPGSDDGSGQRLVLSVRDTGIGMTADELAVAMEPFGQARRGKVLGHMGTGLGLPICAALAQALGGTLRINSIPDSGTTVHMEVPRWLPSAGPSVLRSGVQTGAAQPGSPALRDAMAAGS